MRNILHNVRPCAARTVCNPSILLIQDRYQEQMIPSAAEAREGTGVFSSRRSIALRRSDYPKVSFRFTSCKVAVQRHLVRKREHSRDAYCRYRRLHACKNILCLKDCLRQRRCSLCRCAMFFFGLFTGFQPVRPVYLALFCKLTNLLENLILLLQCSRFEDMLWVMEIEIVRCR